MRNLSWRVKLLGLFTLVLGASLLFQLFYVLPTVRSQQVDIIEAHQAELINNIAWQLETDLSVLESTLIGLSKRLEFINMDIGNQHQTVNQIAEMSPDIMSLYVMDAEGWFVAGTTDDLSVYRTKSYSDKPYYIASFEQGQVYFAAPRSYYDNTLITTAISVPIESDTGERVGLLLGTMSLNPIIEHVTGYPLGEETILFLIDRDGTVVAHSDIDLFALEEGPLSLNFSDEPYVQHLIAGEIGFSERYEHEGVSYLGSYVILESNGWGVVVEVPISAVLGKTGILATQLLWVNIGLFTIALVVTFVLTNQIITQRKQLEEEMQRSNTELIAANKELEAFSYSVSHDLRAPLRSIDGFSKILLEEYSDKVDEKGKDRLNRVRAASQKMGQLIEDMLGLSQVIRKEMQIEAVNLSQLVRIMASQLQEHQPDRQVDFIIAEGLTVNGDRGLLEILIENLLDNAWKFTSTHTNARIEFGITEHEGKPAYFVRDDGVGFDMTYADKLFGAFQRLHTTSEFPGTGIGLATAQRIVYRHGGNIWAEGAIEKGATFYFTV